MNERTPCPFCREAIAAEASVCSHCARDVVLLRAAYAEIANLKARLAAAEAAAPASLAAASLAVTPGGTLSVASAPAVKALPWRNAAYALLWLFYLLPAVLDYGLEFTHTSYVTFALAALTGAALALYARTNVWLVLLLAFGQPYLPLAVLLAARKLSLSMIEDPRLYAIQIALVASFASLAALALFARDRLRSTFRWELSAQWMESNRARFELVQKFILAALGAGGVVFSLVKGVLG